MNRALPATVVGMLCLSALALADAPADQAAKAAAILKDRGVMSFAEKAAGFVHLAARQDAGRIERAYGINDQIRDKLNEPEVNEAFKNIDTVVPFEMDLVAFDILDAQTCSMLFVIHGAEGPIGIKVYMQLAKGAMVQRVEIVLDWEEIETLAHRMEKLPIGYHMTVTRIQDEKP
jgi:hypothetical protein